MFTVIIAQKEHIDAIQQENKLFFEPFLENKELAFCFWDPVGQNLNDAVPGLLDTVGRRKDWRAIILNNCTMASAKTRNPFDVVSMERINDLIKKKKPESNLKLDENLDEKLVAWEASWKAFFADLLREKETVYREALSKPFQKLATWLCFRPEEYIRTDVREKQDVHDWAMNALGRDDKKPSVWLETMERNQYKQELRLKEEIRRKFVAENYLSIAYPSEVHCITLRSAENNYFDPDAFWNIRQDSAYSNFADYNMYFDRMRFMVFDMLPPTHRNFRADYIRFLATVLVFGSNPVPGSAMQARHLYRLEVDVDDTPLCTLVTSYDKKLSSTAEVIEIEMDRIRSEIPGKLSDKDAEALFCTPRDISVMLDESCAPDKVLAEQDYGLYFDLPEDEHKKWTRDYQISERSLTYIAKQQSRAVRRSVSQMHMSSEVTDVNVSRLTPLQIDDIREYTENAEDEMVASIPRDFTDVSEYTQRMAEESKNVEKAIARRMTKKTTTILSAICLGLFFACFLPFLFSIVGIFQTVLTAIILSAVMLGVLAAIMFICLLFLRTTVVNAVRQYNATAKDVMNDIQSSMKQFAKYLSASCNVRRGHAVQNYAKENLDEYTMSLRIRRKHLEDIRRTRAYLAEEYHDYLAGMSFCDETMSRPYEYDFDQRTEYAYPAPFLAGDCRQIEFVSNGNLVTVPSSYITKILVRMEGIYEQ